MTARSPAHHKFGEEGTSSAPRAEGKDGLALITHSHSEGSGSEWLSLTGLLDWCDWSHKK